MLNIYNLVQAQHADCVKQCGSSTCQQQSCCCSLCFHGRRALSCDPGGLASCLPVGMAEKIGFGTLYVSFAMTHTATNAISVIH